MIFKFVIFALSFIALLLIYSVLTIKLKDKYKNYKKKRKDKKWQKIMNTFKKNINKLENK